MSCSDNLPSNSTPALEAASAELGDSRRTARYVQIVEALTRRPDRSIPEALEDEAAQEGYYRFVRNPNIEPSALLEPHILATAARAQMLDHVLCIHDTTEFSWTLGGETMRAHLARLSNRRQGFKWHSSIITSADSTRAPLGTVAAQPFVHESVCPDDATVRAWEERGGIFANEKWRWYQGIEESAMRLVDVPRVTHVMDREGDDFETLFCLDTDGYDYVVRMCLERRVYTGPRRSDYESIKDALGRQTFSEPRTVELSARSAPNASKTHPVRRARSARLRARAVSVEIWRPKNVPSAHAPDRLEVQVVQVREVNPPADEEPIEWLLITSHSTDTDAQIWQVIDWYRSRWVIEEFFKAIKTGCGYSALQHRSAKTLLCALSASVLIAHHLLVLRHLGRHAPSMSADAVVTDTQLGVLRATKRKYLSDEPTVHEAMMAVAKLGGHRTSNGEPGWQVLGRGWQRLLEYEYAYTLGMQAQREM
jgi:hypothetical protein